MALFPNGAVNSCLTAPYLTTGNSSNMFGLWASRWRLSGVMKINWEWVIDMITAFVGGGVIVIVISVILFGSPG